jgi:hypothetical protein
MENNDTIELWVCPKGIDKSKMLFPKVTFVYSPRFQRYEEIYYFGKEV